MIAFSRSGGQSIGAYWKALCECGTIVEVLAKRVVAGRVRSCEKCKKSHKLEHERKIQKMRIRSTLDRLYVRDLRKAVDSGIEWTLTPEIYKELSRRNCIYCNAEPTTGKRHKSTKLNKLCRMNTTGRWSPENTAPICSVCDEWKGTSNSEDFVRRILSTSAYIQSVLSPKNK